MLIVNAGAVACAIPVEHVDETMRPLPIEPVAGAPPFVRGLSIIRGAPVPVVDLAQLLDPTSAAVPHERGRFVTLRTGGRIVALAVEHVSGVRQIDDAALAELPPLFQHIPDGVIETVSASDTQLLVVLHTARLLPNDDGWVPAAPAASRG